MELAAGVSRRHLVAGAIGALALSIATRAVARGMKDPTAHGEMVAIRNFLKEHGPDLLKGTTLYTSGESCPMCIGGDHLVRNRACRIRRLDRPARHENRTDHGYRQRDRQQDAVPRYRDHRRRARRRGDEAVQVASRLSPPIAGTPARSAQDRVHCPSCRPRA
jgi:hypothetical protein